MDETWRDIPEFPDHYQVSDQGAVRRKPGHYGPRKERTLRPIEQTSGHLAVNLSVGNKRHRRYIHRLVASAFLDDENTVVRHLDGNPGNNDVTNLAYGTQRENMLDAMRHGTYVQNPYPVRDHCKHGHPFSAENTRLRKDSGRECLTCRKAIKARYLARLSGQ